MELLDLNLSTIKTCRNENYNLIRVENGLSDFYTILSTNRFGYNGDDALLLVSHVCYDLYTLVKEIDEIKLMTRSELLELGNYDNSRIVAYRGEFDHENYND